jgi:hypothetical protein
MTLRPAVRVCGSLILAVALLVIWMYSVTGAARLNPQSSSLPGGPTPAPAVGQAPGTHRHTGAGTTPRGHGPASGHTQPLGHRPPTSSPTPGGTGHHSTPPATPSPGNPGVPTSAELQAALLTAGQIPGGTYTVMPSSSVIGTGSLGTCAALSAGGAGVTAQASVFYTAGQAGPYIEEALLQDSVRGAEQMVSALTVAAQSCGPIPLSVDGYNLLVTLQAESFPAIGDQAAAVAVNVRLAGGSVTLHVADIAAVRLGGTVIEVTNGGYPLAGALTSEATSDAYDKVAAARW